MTKFDSLPEMFFARARQYAARPRYRYKDARGWRDVDWEASARRVRTLAAGLINLGVAPGDRVALLAGTRPEWMEVDLAIQAAGGVTVPIYQSNLPDECGYIVHNSESAIVFAENEAQLAKIRTVQRDGFSLGEDHHQVDVRKVITFEETGDGEALSLQQLQEARASVADSDVDERSRRVARDALATIVYTSGTTGPPKGVMQSHQNHLSAVEHAAGLRMVAEGDVDFFFLPLAHSFARFIEYLGLYSGTVTAFARSIDTLIDDVREARPHLFPAVPRIYEKVYSRVQGTREQATGLRRRMLDWSFRVGGRRSEQIQAGKAAAPLLAAQARVADRLVFEKIQALLGGRIKYCVSGGAPLAPEIQRFFHAAGLLILEGYGLTETTPILTVNRPDCFRFGTVGLPLDCVTLKIAKDGEILAQGPNVASGYYKRPEATREAWDEEGWFHTGDIGEIDGDGFLRITDRKKDLIKTSGGKYVAPQPIENMLKTKPHISQVVVIGDRKKYCVGLVTLDADEVQQWSERQGVTLPADRAAWCKDERVVKLIESEIEDVNQDLPSYETLKYFRILPTDFSVESGELTPSLKVKRKVIAERYGNVIEEMY
jgi:long-chain acyl-CoA synthetase